MPKEMLSEMKKAFVCLLIVFFECNCCNQLLACCNPKEYTKRDYMRGDEFLGHGEIGNQYSFEFDYYNVICRTGTPYIHDLYCREKGFFYKFFLQQHITSRTYYLCWTYFEHVLKKFLGVVWIYKTWKAFEFYYGSVIGIGWYPQSLNFNKYFRIGFFDMFINLTSVFMNVCHFLCRKYFHMVHEKFRNRNKKKLPDLVKILNMGLCIDTNLFDLYTDVIKDTKYICILDRNDTSSRNEDLLDSLNGFIALLSLLCGVSFINIKTNFGIKIKMLQLIQIEKLMKRKFCSLISNVSILVDSTKKNSDSGKGSIHKITYPLKDVFIYSYMYESHFFFGERDHIFWLLLELFIPNIEINISALS